MKRYISYKDNSHYTFMLEIIEAIGGKNLNYNWLITNIEAYPQNEKYNELVCGKEYLFISNNELLDMLSKEDFQWIWGVFSAIPKEYQEKEVVKKCIPYADGNEKICDPIIQHPFADIEIVAFDSSYVFIVAKDEKIVNKFKRFYPESKEYIQEVIKCKSCYQAIKKLFKNICQKNVK